MSPARLSQAQVGDWHPPSAFPFPTCCQHPQDPGRPIFSFWCWPEPWPLQEAKPALCQARPLRSGPPLSPRARPGLCPAPLALAAPAQAPHSPLRSVSSACLPSCPGPPPAPRDRAGPLAQELPTWFLQVSQPHGPSLPRVLSPCQPWAPPGLQPHPSAPSCELCLGPSPQPGLFRASPAPGLLCPVAFPLLTALLCSWPTSAPAAPPPPVAHQDCSLSLRLTPARHLRQHPTAGTLALRSHRPLWPCQRLPRTGTFSAPAPSLAQTGSTLLSPTLPSPPAVPAHLPLTYCSP